MNKQESVRIAPAEKHLDDKAKQRISNQQKARYLDRVAGARRYIDQNFITQFGVPAYPHLDILLIVRSTDRRFNIKQISDLLLMSPGITTRYLNIMVELGLIEMDASGVRLCDAGWNVLFNLVDKNLSNSFEIVE